MYLCSLGTKPSIARMARSTGRQIYGEESFKLKAPVYPSEYDAIRKAKEVNVEKLKKLAEDWKQASPLPPVPASSHGASCTQSIPAGCCVPLCMLCKVA